MSNRHIMAKDRSGRPRYLGDGVYAVYDGRGVWLTAEDGIRATDAIYLEPEVFVSLTAFFTGMMQQTLEP